MNKLYPLMLKLNGKKIVIIGGGKVALRKAQGVVAVGGSVIVVSPEILPELLVLESVIWRQKNFEIQDIADAHIIYAATNHREVNQQVAEAVQSWQWFNDTSQPENSDFYTPAVIRSEEITLAVSTEGRSPAQAKRVKQQLIDFLATDK